METQGLDKGSGGFEFRFRGNYLIRLPGLLPKGCALGPYRLTHK